MYIDEQGGAAPMTAGAGWQVTPDQVRNFAAAVEQVRADLRRITARVDSMSTPNYAPMLGTSPVGKELADKFIDRMGSEHGLKGQLEAALQRMEEFVASAELTAKTYQQMDDDSAAGYTYS